ncbi:MAG: c-type cytochrome [Candidatus Brocadiales bacterium]|nr:c-type cytochrome [Candidatus Brocadiales bacterium]
MKWRIFKYKGLLSFLFTVCFIFFFYGAEAFAQTLQRFRTYTRTVSGKLPETVDTIIAGKIIYEKKCYYCHGIKGEGNGSVSPRLDPKPRDFTKNEYKIRSTQQGKLPTDEDIFRIITSGIEGTAMPSWGTLSEAERWQVIDYIKTFNKDFLDNKCEEIEIGKEISETSETIKNGEKLFREAKCFLCHGNKGRGDGVITVTMNTEWNMPYKARDLTKRWLFKGGSGTGDIYRTISTGFNMTPMGTYKDYLSDEERWHLAHYVRSISHEMKSKVVIKSGFIEGEIPSSADDSLWISAESSEIPLAGQILIKPGLWNPSINSIMIRSLYNKDNIAFLLEWNDRTNRQEEAFTDAIALEFPVKIPEGTRKPSFAMGGSGKQVYILRYEAYNRSDSKNTLLAFKQDGTGRKNTKNISVENVKNIRNRNEIVIDEYNARGHKTLKKQPAESQKTRGIGQWENGRWRVLIKRPLFSADKNDTQFEKGKLIPLALAAWDGSNGEYGGLKSVSPWYYITLKTPTPYTVYGYIAIAVIIGVSVEFFFIARYRRRATA